MQWGSVWDIQMVEKRSDTKWSSFPKPFEYLTARPFDNWQMDAIIFSCVLFQYLNGWSSTLDKAYRLTI